MAGTMVPFKTHVYWVPRSPAGFAGFWFVDHYCGECRERVDTDDLQDHAASHLDAAAVAALGAQSK